MRTTYFTPLLVALLPSALAQGTLPACAETAALSSISASGCASAQASCICASTTYLTTLKSLIAQSCSAADAQAALDFASATCSAAGVPLAIDTPPAAVSSASVNAAAPPAAASSSVSTIPGSAPTTILMSSVSLPPVASMTGSPMSWPTMSGVSNASVTCTTGGYSMSAMPSTFTGAAVDKSVGRGVAVVGAMAGFLGVL